MPNSKQSTKRLPRYVSRRTAASLLNLTTKGFSTWVTNGIVPPPTLGSPIHTPRWDWSEIERWMAGDRSSRQQNLFPPDPPKNPGKRRGKKPRLDLALLTTEMPK